MLVYEIYLMVKQAIFEIVGFELNFLYTQNSRHFL